MKVWLVLANTFSWDEGQVLAVFANEAAARAYAAEHDPQWKKQHAHAEVWAEEWEVKS